MLEINSKVCTRSDPSTVGMITNIMSDGQYEVFINGESTYFSKEFLQLVPSSDLFTSFKNIEQGICGDQSDLNELLVREKMSGQLTNIYYSMHYGNTDFYSHQFRPVLKFIESITNRLIIADEVGLGKTIEALYIWKELQVRENARNLVVFCPSVLGEKWKLDMSDKFGLDAEIVKADILEEKVSQGKRTKRSNGFALICSIESLRIQLNKETSKLLQLLDSNQTETPLFDLTIFDEAHYLRNPATSSFKMAEKVRDCSNNLVLLSATPIQTSTDNLYSLLQLVAPEQFDNKETFNYFLNKNAPVLQLASALQQPSVEKNNILLLCRETERVGMISKVLLQEVRDTFIHNENPSISQRIKLAHRIDQQSYLSLYISRSRKSEVFKNRVIRDCETYEFSLSSWEQDLYDRASYQLKSLYAEKGSFAIIIKQRVIASCLPVGISNLYKQLSEEDKNNFMQYYEEEEDFLYEQTYPLPALKDFPSFETLAANDSKYKELLEGLTRTLKPIPQENKIIIFTGFRMTADYLKERLISDKFKVSYIHGAMGSKKYLVIDEFKKTVEPSILLSTEVGSEGIDLQFCSAIINYDLPWNPMRVEQRIGRIDRIGQKSKTIKIRNIMCRDTIEDRILKRLHDRINLFTNTIGNLDDILGLQVEKLLIDLSNKALTNEELDKQLANNSLVEALTNQLNNNLELSAPMFASVGQYILESIKKSNKQQHYITSTDIFSYVNKFLEQTYPDEYRLEPHPKDKFCYKILLPSEATHKLAVYCRKHPEYKTTRLAHESSPNFYSYFQSQESNSYSNSYREIIDIDHPLIKWIDEQVRMPTYQKNSCSVIHLELRDIPKCKLVPGLYTYYIERWKISGLLNIVELKYFLCPHDENLEMVTPDEAEQIITKASQKGYSGFEYYEFYYPDSAEKSLTVLRDQCRREYTCFVDEYLQRTLAFKEQREGFINQTYKVKIASSQSLVDKMLYENKIQAVKLNQAKIAKYKVTMENLLRENRETNMTPSTTPIAIGIICIR